MDNTDDEKQVVTKSPIETAKPSPRAIVKIETDKTSTSAAVHVVSTRARVEIVTRAPGDKG